MARVPHTPLGIAHLFHFTTFYTFYKFVKRRTFS